MKISIWGSELSAWVTAGMMAKCGNHVYLAQENLPEEGFSEPLLDDLLNTAINEKQLILGNSPNIYDSEAHFFCFPADKKGAALNIASVIGEKSKTPSVIINQSNFGIGSTTEIQEKLNSSVHQIAAYVPDNMPEGKAIDHLKNLSSLIVGCSEETATQSIKALFRPFLIDSQQVLVMTPQEAEFAKFAVTGMLALRIGYINELANLADELGLDIEPVRHAMTTDPRISPQYLRPGCGFGGMNFSQYIKGLAETLKEERRSTLLQSVLEQNETQKETPFRKLWRYFNGNLSGKQVAIWGLAFKPNTASIANAPSLKIIDALLSQGVKIKVHDPAAASAINRVYSENTSFETCEDIYSPLENSDALLLLTEWRMYSSPDLAKMRKIMKKPLIIDGRNLLDKQQAVLAGFHYLGIGR